MCMPVLYNRVNIQSVKTKRDRSKQSICLEIVCIWQVKGWWERASKNKKQKQTHKKNARTEQEQEQKRKVKSNKANKN